MRPTPRIWLLPCLALLLGASPSPEGGSLTGHWRGSDGQTHEVMLSYHRELQSAGRISVELPSGEVFAGEYLRLAGERKAARIERIYARWRIEDFDRFDRGPTGQPWSRAESGLESFRRRHRERVVATLISETRSSMRCSFELVAPERGLPGGASGRCQLTDGSVIDVGV